MVNEGLVNVFREADNDRQVVGILLATLVAMSHAGNDVPAEKIEMLIDSVNAYYGVWHEGTTKARAEILGNRSQRVLDPLLIRDAGRGSQVGEGTRREWHQNAYLETCLAHMDFIYGMACGVLGLLLAQGLALVHAWWSFNRKMAKRPIEREIETSWGKTRENAGTRWPLKTPGS
jgi:hypothetical protein